MTDSRYVEKYARQTRAKISRTSYRHKKLLSQDDVGGSINVQSNFVDAAFRIFHWILRR